MKGGPDNSFTHSWYKLANTEPRNPPTPCPDVALNIGLTFTALAQYLHFKIIFGAALPNYSYLRSALEDGCGEDNFINMEGREA